MWLVLLALWAMPASGDEPFHAIEKLIAAGRYREAESALSQIPAESARWHLLASKAHEGLGDPARAVAEVERALAIEPLGEALHLQLGQIFLGHNTPQAAFDVFDEAHTLLPDSLLLRLGKGLALKELSRYDEAAVELRECLRLKPDLAIAFDALATVYLHSKSFQDAIRLADEHRAEYPGSYLGYYFGAAGREGLKIESAEVESLTAAAIRLNPNFAASHALHGKIRLQAGDAGAAITSLERAVQLRPNYTPAVLHLAQAYRAAGREADAQRAFERVRELKKLELVPRPALRYRRGEAQK